MGRDCGWQNIDHFRSLADYESVRASVAQQVNSGQVLEVRVAKPYSGLKTIDERWFRCSKSGEVGRLIAPDPPFPGIFQRV